MFWLTLVLALCLLLLIAALARIARNTSVDGLEDYARKNDLFYAPMSKELVESMDDWSTPVELKVGVHKHPLLVEMQVRKAQKPA